MAAVRKQLTGVWEGFAVAGKGETPDRGPVKLCLTITPNTIQGTEVKQFGKEGTVEHGTGEFTLDLAMTPRHLDATQKNDGMRPITYFGILALDGDTLKWCVRRGKGRPTT